MAVFVGNSAGGVEMVGLDKQVSYEEEDTGLLIGKVGPKTADPTSGKEVSDVSFHSGDGVSLGDDTEVSGGFEKMCDGDKFIILILEVAETAGVPGEALKIASPGGGGRVTGGV